MNVVITGASSGIGRALARTFSRKGHAVLAVARREERLLELCRETAEKHEAAVHCLALDITSPGAPQILLEEAVRVFGKVHVLINNAGMSPYQEFHELNSVHLRQILALNIQVPHGTLSFVHAPYAGAWGTQSCGERGLRGRVCAASQICRLCGVQALHPDFHQSALLRVPPNQYPGQRASPGRDADGIPRPCRSTAQKVRPKSHDDSGTGGGKAYPAILKGRRVIVPGAINKLAVLMGKLFPFPLSIRVMDFIYDQTVDPIAPTYPL